MEATANADTEHCEPYTTSHVGTTRACLAQWGVAIGSTGWSDGDWLAFHQFMASIDSVLFGEEEILPPHPKYHPLTGYRYGTFKELQKDDVADFVVCVQSYGVGEKKTATGEKCGPAELGFFLALRSLTLIARASEFARVRVKTEVESSVQRDANAPSPKKGTWIELVSSSQMSTSLIPSLSSDILGMYSSDIFVIVFCYLMNDNLKC
ncbi:hypothetical protein R1flu_018305 [Riccia fluitans]|uniref:Uncharacterized protein n=1 Tax=Riccia fluitans TaxID=41844 RepID=A0ABD1ZFG1_9MARC